MSIDGEEFDANEPWVEVASFRDLPQAHIAHGILEAQGLTPRLSDEYTVGADWLISSAIGGVGLGVPQSQAEKARQLLEEAAPGLDASDLPEELASGVDEADQQKERAYFSKHEFGKRLRAALAIVFLAPAVFALFFVAWLLRELRTGSGSTEDAV